MMKGWFGTLVLAFALVGGVFLAAEETKRPGPSLEKILKSEPKYVGAAVCGDCHAKQRIGQQFQAWTGSKHPRASIVLNTGHAAMISPRAKRLVKAGYGERIRQEAKRLNQDTDCLKCHATASNVDVALREPTFHIEDGVQCERCHGPGNRHTAWYRKYGNSRRRQPPKEAYLRKPELKECLECHDQKASHAVMKPKPFDPEKAWTRIAHPLPKKAKQQ